MASDLPREPEKLDMKRLLSEALAMAEVAVFGFDSTGRLALVNTRGEKLTGYSSGELLGTDPLPRLFGDKAELVRRRWFAAKEGAPVKMEVALRTRGDAMRVVRWRVGSHIPSSGAPAALVVVGMERTRLRDLDVRSPAKTRPTAAGVLAAGLAHEIRNPLNGASLHLSVLERALSRVPDLPLAAAEAITVLRAETTRLSALVTEFLEVAYPRKLSRRMCDLNEIVRQAAALLEREIEGRTVRLSIESSPKPALVDLDPEHVRGALANLLRNALEATGKDGRVVLRTRHSTDCAEIDVEDNGVGIADPNAPIFDAFYTTKERGTGLGLSIVQRVVSDHGGEIAYRSEPGRTVFTVRLPIMSRARSK
jgi:PAS domain S-box-containing protein